MSDVNDRVHIRFEHAGKVTSEGCFLGDEAMYAVLKTIFAAYIRKRCGKTEIADEELDRLSHRLDQLFTDRFISEMALVARTDFPRLVAALRSERAKNAALMNLLREETGL